MTHIEVIDGRKLANPEDLAMLQALYSRSAESVRVHIEKVEKGGSSRFMGNYVVGYNHKSIADCGSTTVFIEGVSTLAAKAIQDWPLYSGQETSTRYIDMSKQPIEDPVGNAASSDIHARWMQFYVDAQPRVIVGLREKYPMLQEERERLIVQGKDPDKVYEGAIKARTFDILRAFLPAGITTQLSWHTNLRQAADHLVLLTHHPSGEMRDIGRKIRKALGEAYPDSGFIETTASVAGVETPKDKERRDGERLAREIWEGKIANAYAYQDLDPAVLDTLRLEGSLFWTTVSDLEATLETYGAGQIIKERPRGCVLPHFLADYGSISYAFMLDFGSFRDIQRHRNGVCRMPLLTTEHGFDPWYLEQLGQLDTDLCASAQKLIKDQMRRIKDLQLDPVYAQYYVALGYRVTCQVTYAIPAAVYVMELRSGKMIHPTLRRVIHSMIREFQSELPFIPLHVDMDPNDWDVRRGTQTITEKS